MNAQRKAANERKRQHREAALRMDVDWRPFRVVPATVRAIGDPVGVSRPSSHCARLEDGRWQYVGREVAG